MNMSKLFLLATTASYSAVPHALVSGSPAKASDVNDNFNYLDSTVQKKANQATVDVLTSAINAKADVSLKDSVGNLRAAVGGKADTSALSAVKASMPSAVNLSGYATLPNLKDTASAIRSSIPASANLSGYATLTNLKDSSTAIRSAIPSLSGYAKSNDLVSYATASSLSNYATTASQTLGLGGKADTGWVRADTTKVRLLTSQVGALQTSISNYLPLAGGQLTGPLSGTSAAFSSTVTANGSVTGAGLTSTGAITYNDADGQSGLTIAPLPGYVSYGCIFPRGVTPSLTNYSFVTQYYGGNVETSINGTSASNLRVNNVVVVRATTGAAEIDGNLTVAGIIHASSGTITVPDYVFEPSYKLPALSEVEAYTQEHKHLPEIPSATEIEKGGMDLAQMNLILLKKVEELTLHAIEQQKQVDAAAKKMEVQERRVTELKASMEAQQHMIDELKTAGAK